MQILRTCSYLGRVCNGALVAAEGALAAFASAGEQPEQAGAQKAAADGELAGLVACLRRTGRLPEALAAARDAAGAEVKQAIRRDSSETNWVMPCHA